MVSDSVSKKFDIKKSIGFGIRNILYKKVSDSVSEIFVIGNKVSDSVSFRFLVSSHTVVMSMGGKEIYLGIGNSIPGSWKSCFDPGGKSPRPSLLMLIMEVI